VNLVMFSSMFHCAKTLLGLSLKLLSMMSLGVCILVQAAYIVFRHFLGLVWFLMLLSFFF